MHHYRDNGILQSLEARLRLEQWGEIEPAVRRGELVAIPGEAEGRVWYVKDWVFQSGNRHVTLRACRVKPTYFRDIPSWKLPTSGSNFDLLSSPQDETSDVKPAWHDPKAKPPKPIKPIDQMTLQDYRDGVAAMFHEYSLLLTP